MSPSNWHFTLLAPIYDSIGGMINRRDPVELMQPEAGDRVLDIAGGTGLLQRKFNEIPLSSWTVLDLNYWMMKRGRDKGRNCQFVQGSAYELPFRSNQFDGGMITDALHHMGQKKRVLAEAKRVLRHDGRLLIEEFDPGTPIGSLTEMAEWLGGMGSEFIRPSTLCDLVRTAGLEIERTQRHQYLFYIIASPGT